MATDSHVNIKRWLRKSIQLRGSSPDEVASALVQAAKQYGFKIRKKETTGKSIKVEAIFGSKLIAFILGFIPFCHHLPSGKRLILSAKLTGGPASTLKIQILPYMELMGDEEIGGVTQSMGERASDEYYGARKMYQILVRIHKILGVQPSEENAVFDTRAFVKDTFMGVLIYPLDSYKTPQIIHMPSEPGPYWCWGGFVLPEVWFLWNEIWGVSLLAALPSALYFKAEAWGIGLHFQYLLLGLIVGTRLLLGKFGNKLFYAMYGYWPNAKS